MVNVVGAELAKLHLTKDFTALYKRNDCRIRLTTNYYSWITKKFGNVSEWEDRHIKTLGVVPGNFPIKAHCESRKHINSEYFPNLTY